MKIEEWKHLQEEEASTWLLKDPEEFKNKANRETARYPLMIKQMGLNNIHTVDMTVLDIGGGPVGLSHYLPAKRRIILDPLTDEYKKMYPCSAHIKGEGESIPFEDASIDLVIITNALDHCENPIKVLEEATRVLKPYSGYLAIHSAINNAITNPHPAHAININPAWLHEFTDDKYETIWELEYPEVRYSFQMFNGKIGQPAFTFLGRKAIK